ncbi:DUF2092 domain-containing protein [Amorphus orientalis]|uniref:DUF2092 domain-containing protein n=1 Tax=Amorphus orientalis TaxID=649198 RepID=A0AAE3VL77_9HYPH|nr:DUF2092 domain-containing protein [Amorphus orientalis]MDQ0313953.1 hypothetical protein [Amorphus orientalis]
MALTRLFARGLAPWLAALVFCATPALAQDPETGSQSGAAAGETAEAAADAGLAEISRMSDYIGGLSSFEFEAATLFDEPAVSGTPDKRASAFHLAVKRPNKLAMTATFDDGSERKLWFDGTTVTLANVSAKTYIELPFDGDIDGLVDAVESRLSMVVPPLAFAISDPFARLEENAIAADFIGERTLGDETTRVVRIETVDTVRQFWIADGDAPLPERLVTTYIRETGHPEMVTNFRSFSEETVPDAAFQAEIADDWTEVPLNPGE